MTFALSTEWFIRDKIVLVRAKAHNISEHDFIAADESLCRDYLDRTFAQKIHVIFDNSVVMNTPRLRTIPRFADHPKLGHCVSFGTKTFRDIFGRRVRSKRLESFSSMGDCLNFLYQSDPHMPRRLPKYL
jgi:hypothetical protein